LVPGIFATLSIEGPSIDNLFVVPASALQKDGMIWAVSQDDTLMTIKPDILYSDGDNVILQSVNNTKRIVTSRVSGVTQGSSVIYETQSLQSKTGAP